jgi:hypothetical protein
MISTVDANVLLNVVAEKRLKKAQEQHAAILRCIDETLDDFANDRPMQVQPRILRFCEDVFPRFGIWAGPVLAECLEKEELQKKLNQRGLALEAGSIGWRITVLTKANMPVSLRDEELMALSEKYPKTLPPEDIIRFVRKELLTDVLFKTCKSLMPDAEWAKHKRWSPLRTTWMSACVLLV